ncbi:hypothetical protein [uncultured Oxalicibacterium sp.]|uniref:hypothetical protein n=1 Tax=uncultured Oxalicibacterium sp. TaxID=1168540 RepID=UPI0025CECD0F|nr:hypothetical protein [uncultured Oxalicibacterium sp.]
MFERLMTGLHASLVAAFAVLATAAVMLGRGFELLAATGGMGAWWFIAAWLLLSAMIAVLPEAIVRWKAGLRITAIALVVTALAGLRQDVPLAVEMSVSLIVLAALLLFAASRLQARVLKKINRPQAAVTVARTATDWPRRLSWWVLALCMLEAFRLSHLGIGDQQKAIGCLGMLIAFFVMLPSLSVSTWYPRLASACWLLSAVFLAGVAWTSSNISSAGGTVLVAMCASLLWFAVRQDTDKSELPQ